MTRPASLRQRQYVAGLMDARNVPPSLAAEVLDARDAGLTHEDCTVLIPQLQACPRRPGGRGHHYEEDMDDWTDEYGHDDSPDMGVHRHDGGGSFPWPY